MSRVSFVAQPNEFSFCLVLRLSSLSQRPEGLIDFPIEGGDLRDPTKRQGLLGLERSIVRNLDQVPPPLRREAFARKRV